MGVEGAGDWSPTPSLCPRSACVRYAQKLTSEWEGQTGDGFSSERKTLSGGKVRERRGPREGRWGLQRREGCSFYKAGDLSWSGGLHISEN